MIKLKHIIISSAVTILINTSAAIAYEKTFQLDDVGKHEFSFELDPYYSNIAYTFSLTDKPIPKSAYANERSIYYYLITNIYHPRFVLLEASVYPLPIVGVYIKKNHEEFYSDSQVSKNFNAVKAVTAGFPEPWAYSMFLGNVVDFVKADNKIVGKGYSGLLFSYGNRHIVDNLMVDDNWFEVELKLKGSDIRTSHNVSWSYALGYKNHLNEDIRDTFYISIKRNRVDYVIKERNPFLNFFIRNSEQEIRLDFDVFNIERGKIIRYLFLFGKKIVIIDNKMAFSFSVGTLKTVASGYSGRLEQKIDEHWSLILRPNVNMNF